MQVAHRADFCVGYFNLRGWRYLDCYVEPWSGTEGNRCRVLVGMQRAPEETLTQLFSLSGNGAGIDRGQAVRLKKQLAESFRHQLTLGTPTAQDEAGLRQLANQLRQGKLVVKLYLRSPLHAKLYLTHRHDAANPRTGYVGSSNLTFSGVRGNGELNVDVLDHDASQKLADWFEDRWHDPFCVDISEELISVVEESWAREALVSPYHIYIKMAYHLALEAREGLRTFDVPGELDEILFPYQSAAVKIAAHHLMKRGGVLIGDVVGLGKTLMATALARLMEELEGTSTLIICPKNLEKMWQSYVDTYGLRARVMPISVVQKELGDVPARFRRVLIDESLNLRNRDSKRYAAIHEYIRQSGSKVILLSATPYNKSFTDLSSQLSLFIDEGTDLGIRPEAYVRELGGEVKFNAEHSQTPIYSLAAFERSLHPDDWRELMRLFLIRRTRSFIKDNYAKTDPKSGRKYLLFGNAEPNESYSPLYEGKMIHQFTNSFSEPRYWLNLQGGRKALLRSTADDQQELPYQRYRLGYRTIASSTNERTMIATVLPPNIITGNSINVSSNSLGPEELLYLVSILNSFVVDASLRKRVSANVNMLYVYQLPVPRLAKDDPNLTQIVERAAKLICTTPEFDDLAIDVGLEGHQNGVTDEAERTQLRAELDALVAHLYGLNEEEFSYILSTFPRLETYVRNAAICEYRLRIEDPDAVQTERLIQQGEGKRLEFKEAAVWNAYQQRKDGEMYQPVLKAVASFMNGEGGTLIIGVEDRKGSVVGLAEDFKHADPNKPNRDGYCLWLSNRLDRLGEQHSTNYDIHFHTIQNKEVCRITVRRASEPVWYGDDLYVRSAAGKKKLSTQAAHAYIKQRWNGQ